MSIMRRLAILSLPLWLIACAHKAVVPAPAQDATPDRPAWMPAPLTSMAYSSRIGIMTVLDNDFVNVRSGTIGNSRDVERADFDLPGYTTESLRRAILTTPYQPVLVRPSARLLREKDEWQKQWSDKNQSFESSWQREFDAVMRQNRLKLLIVVTSPEVNEGVLGSQSLMGSGFYMRSFLGKHQNAVFSTIHFYRISGEPGKLLSPVSSPEERTYAEVPKLPSDLPEPIPRPMQNAIEKSLRDLIDQKVAAFVTLMK